MRPIAALSLLVMAMAPAAAQAPKRMGSAESPIAASVDVPPGSRLVYVSGQVPDVVNSAAPEGSVERFGDTETQTRSVIRKIEGVLKQNGLGLSDVVMMRVFLVAPPGQARMDFAAMMRGYRAFFGTPQQPNKPARSTMQVGGLVDPGWLVEIEVTAATK
jgi:enamine deaminase RidA (YjgF/YER057c/UK114 family)